MRTVTIKATAELISALETSLTRAVGEPAEQELADLLRSLDPGNALLAARDRIAREMRDGQRDAVVQITAETITDEQIRAIDAFDIPSEVRADALGLPVSLWDGRGALTAEDVRRARERCAAVLNAVGCAS